MSFIRSINSNSEQAESGNRGSTDSVYSSDYETFCEETASEQSVPIVNTVGIVQTTEVASVEHFTTTMGVVESYILIEETFDSSGSSSGSVSVYSSCVDVKESITQTPTNINRPMSKRMLDFLELITTLSFESAPENVVEVPLVSFYRRMQSVMEQYYLPRCYQLPSTYQQVLCEYSGYVNKLIGDLSKTNDRIGALVRRNSLNCRLVSMRNELPADFLSRNANMLKEMNHAAMCHTMVVNLQLLRDNNRLAYSTRSGCGCPRRRNHRRFRLSRVGIQPDVSVPPNDTIESPSLLPPSNANNASTMNHHSHCHSRTLFCIYAMTFVFIFSCLIVNFKCE